MPSRSSVNALAIREKSLPEEWSTSYTRSLLGGSLLGQGKFAEAEPLILSGYEGMKAREAKIPRRQATFASGVGKRRETLRGLAEARQGQGMADEAGHERLRSPPGGVRPMSEASRLPRSPPPRQ